jgi:hypothetical protein
MIALIYIGRATAKAAGLTHEGTLFGVPAWFAGDDDGELSMATPKVPLLHAWCWLADKFYAFGAMLIPADAELRSPIHITNRI